MGVSLIDLIKEELREQRTGDDQFCIQAPYAFVLRGPELTGPLGPFGEAAFPLPVNPTDLTYSMPFASEITPLQQGGVVSEEAGIVIGEISIDASMGFKPKMDWSTNMGPGGGDFSGLLGTQGSYFENLSGQMHFWRLANRCFDAYSALKKDPETAHKTKMEFHSIRDQLHLTVIPREFALHRNAAKERVSYRLVCRLAVVGPAGKLEWKSPDKNWIDKITDTIAQIRSTLQAVAATVDDLTSALDEIRRTISSVVSILDDITTVAASFSALIDGTKRFLDIPRQTLVALTENCEAVANVAAGIAGWPADATQALYDLEDQLHALTVAGTTYFTESWDRQIERYQRMCRNKPPEVGSREWAIESTPGRGDTSSTVSDVFGGGEKPGDARRDSNTTTDARLVAGQYSGFTERVVGHGDTLQSLAARHLGDARKWIDLAIVNELKPPYITDKASMPGALRTGDKIVIPTSTPRASPDVITTGAPETGASQAEANLGVDFLMARQGSGSIRGWQIDVAGGSVDVLKARGLGNFVQALDMRFATERGHNILYPAIGLPRAVGQKGTVDRGGLRYQFREQLLADRRVERLGSFAFSVLGDALVLTADIQPVGYSSLRTITRTLT